MPSESTNFIAITDRQIIGSGETFDEVREKAAAASTNSDSTVNIYQLMGFTAPVRTYRYVAMQEKDNAPT